MYGELSKINTERNAHSYRSSCWNEWRTHQKSSWKIAENIANLVIKLKRNCDISISNITARNDQYQKKAADENRELKERSHEKKLQFLDHGSTITIRHLNASKIHLNKRGTQVLSNVCVAAIFNISNWQFALHRLASDNIKKFKVGAISGK